MGQCKSMTLRHSRSLFQGSFFLSQGLFCLSGPSFSHSSLYTFWSVCTDPGIIRTLTAWRKAVSHMSSDFVPLCTSGMMFISLEIVWWFWLFNLSCAKILPYWFFSICYYSLYSSFPIFADRFSNFQQSYWCSLGDPCIHLNHILYMIVSRRWYQNPSYSQSVLGFTFSFSTHKAC